MKLVALPAPDPRDVHPPETELPRLWKVSTLASYWNCSKPMIFKLISSGDLKRVRIGKQIRVTESSALAYLKRGK